MRKMHFSIDSLSLVFKKRDRATIISDILKSLIHSGIGKRKTRLKQSANLSTEQVNKYLDLLMRNGYVILADGCLYKPTGKGLRFLQNLESDYLRLKYARSRV